MIPVLYAKNATEFGNNGIGVLKDAVSCIVMEERNGEYTCTLQYPITGNWYGRIAEGSIIKAKANETSNPQLFRISKSSKPIKGIVTFSANHISYDLSGLPLMSLAQTNKTAQAAMTAGFSACPLAHGFTAWSDKTVLESVNIAAPRSLRNFIGGQEGSILALYGGELEFDNFTVKLHVNRGADNGVTIAYGKNLTDAKQDKNIEAAYTHLCPYAVKTVNTYNDDGEIIAQTEELVKLTENVIPLYDPVPYSKALIMDFTDEFSDDEEINETNLRTKANAYISSHELTAPEVNLTVSFIQIWDTPEYKDFAALERVKLCDTVTVRYSELGIDVKAKVVKTVYDSLKERYNSILIGSARANLADTVLNINDRIEEDKKLTESDKNASDVSLNNAIIQATNKITGNAGGYVVLSPANYPEEILIMNTNNKSTATKVWRWNASGLGYSSTGYNGPFGIAMTADGQIVADYISTGTLSAISISGCTISGGTLNIGSGKFEVDSSGNIHAEGYVKATSGVIGGCTITNGALDVPAANISGVLSAAHIDVNGVITAGGISVKTSTLSSVNVQYALSTSDTTAPTTGWSTTAPAWENGKYMWQKTVWTYATGSTSESAATCITGAKGDDGTSVTILGSYATLADLQTAHPTGNPGDSYLVGGDLYVWNGSAWEDVGQIKGDTGDTGVGVSNITEQYYLSDSDTATSGGSWVNTCPAWVSGKYIWTRSYIEWTDGSTSYTTATIAGAINGANETASAATAAVLDIEGHVYYTGTTEIDGGKIRTGTVTALQINATNLHVSAANIDGTLTIGQLPNTVAELSDIPTDVSQLFNDALYVNYSGCVTIIDGRVTADYVEALSISVGAAQITGQLTAAQIDATGITATGVDITGKITATSGEIKNLTISGKLTFGGNNAYYINANYNDSTYYIKLPGFEVDDASGAVFSGELNAPSGNIGGCSIVNGVLRVPVANIDGTITATELEVKNGSYTYFKAGNGEVKIAGFNVDQDSIYNASTFATSSIFLCRGTTNSYIIGGHFGNGWALNIGWKFGVNTSGEMYCTKATITGAIYATSGIIGNETYNFTIGASGTSASLYCGSSSLRGTGGIGTATNNVYLGTDGLSYSAPDSSVSDYTTVIRSGIVMCYGDPSLTGNQNRSVSIRQHGIYFYYAGSTKFSNASSITSYEKAAIEIPINATYAYMSGSWRSASTITVSSDRKCKNSIENIDSRYVDLIDNLTPCRYKLNDDKTGRYHTGFIAQDVKTALEAAGLVPDELAALDCEGEMWGLRYEELIAPIIAKIKALEKRILALEK